MDRSFSEVLERALQGDANAIADISTFDHCSVREAEGLVGAPLIVEPVFCSAWRGALSTVPPPAGIGDGGG